MYVLRVSYCWAGKRRSLALLAGCCPLAYCWLRLVFPAARERNSKNNAFSERLKFQPAPANLVERHYAEYWGARRHVVLDAGHGPRLRGLLRRSACPSPPRSRRTGALRAEAREMFRRRRHRYVELVEEVGLVTTSPCVQKKSGRTPPCTRPLRRLRLRPPIIPCGDTYDDGGPIFF